MHTETFKNETQKFTKQQAIRIAEGVQKRDHFTLHDGQIIYRHESKQKRPHFEIRMVEEIIREVCTMYNRRIRLYEPIVNSLMDRVTNEVFSPSGLHKLVPVKDSLQHFGKSLSKFNLMFNHVLCTARRKLIET